jgi:hypothetical protein
MISMSAFAAVFALSSFFIVAYLVSSEVLLNQIRRTCPGTYNELGRPSLFANNTVPNASRFLVFLLKREYSTSADRRVRTLGSVTRVLFLTATVLFVIAVVLFFQHAAMQ